MTQQKQQPEASESMYYLTQIFEKFEEQEKRVGLLGEKIAKTVEDMMKQVRKLGVTIFDDESRLYDLVDAYKKAMPLTNQLVIDLELRHKALSQPEKLAEQALKQASLSEKQQILPSTLTATSQQQTTPGDHGFFWYMGERRRMGALERIADLQREPQMTGTQRQSDFLNYAKDIPPTMNKLYDWLGGALIRLKLFNCAKTREVCYSQLRTHLEKLATVTVGFSGAIIEFRKELISEREVAYAQASFALETAKTLAIVGQKAGVIGHDSLTEVIKAIAEGRR